MGKWIFNKHTKDFDTLLMTLYYLDGNKEKGNIIPLMEYLGKTGKYKPRNKEEFLGSTSTIKNKINVLKFYGLIYEVDKMYMISSLGKEILKHYELEKFEEIELAFANSLFNIQFEHPYNESKSNVYPFRMIFSLMQEPKLENRVYNYEILLFLFDYEFSNNQSATRIEEYEQLVNKILKYRLETKNDFMKISEDIEKIPKIADKIHQFDYYVAPILEAFKLITIEEKSTEKCFFLQGTYTKRYFQIKEMSVYSEKDTYIQSLVKELPCCDPIIEKDGHYTTREWVSLITNRISNTYINICCNEKKYVYYKELTDQLIYHAKNTEDKSPYIYEEILEEIFNEFEDVHGEKVGGAGNTDVECVYRGNGSYTKFNVEAKSTGKKLSNINAGRLIGHQANRGAEYTLVIAPEYVPSVIKFDIKNTNICTIRTGIFAEYIQNLFNSESSSYSELNKVISTNQGTDISEEISKLSTSRFGKTIN